tara:strand:+ start:165 stop:314 length:150 start_codon:yes stop_codon:yes gene_type:complete
LQDGREKGDERDYECCEAEDILVDVIEGHCGSEAGRKGEDGEAVWERIS